MNNKQKEAIDFYLRNDYLLINALLWNDLNDLDKKIKIIVDCNNAKIKEAIEVSPEKYWGCSKEESQKILNIFKSRSYKNIGKKEKQEIIARAKEDIKYIFESMSPLTKNLILYRNVDKKFANNLQENSIQNMLGFSSCSTEMHIPHDKMYGSEDSVIYKIYVPKGFMALRLDQMPNLRNEPDEVILPPMKCKIEKIEEKNGKKFIKIIALEVQKSKFNNKDLEK